MDSQRINVIHSYFRAEIETSLVSSARTDTLKIPNASPLVPDEGNYHSVIPFYPGSTRAPGGNMREIIAFNRSSELKNKYAARARAESGKKPGRASATRRHGITLSGLKSCA